MRDGQEQAKYQREIDGLHERLQSLQNRLTASEAECKDFITRFGECQREAAHWQETAEAAQSDVKDLKVTLADLEARNRILTEKLNDAIF